MIDRGSFMAMAKAKHTACEELRLRTLRLLIERGLRPHSC